MFTNMLILETLIHSDLNHKEVVNAENIWPYQYFDKTVYGWETIDS